MKIRHLGALAIIPTLILTSCGDAPTRSGQRADVVTLTSLTAGNVGGDVAEALAEVTAGSAVEVDAPVSPSYQPAGHTLDEDDDYEVHLIDLVRDGESDIATIRADMLASAGATSLAVLQTPFLVGTEEQAAKIADDPIAADLMAGLQDIGLVGLALVPGGLRHPFGYGAAVLGPEDYDGQGFNVRHGDGVAAIVEALGATPDTSAGEFRTGLVQSGALRIIDSSLQQPGSVDLPAVVTSNVTFYTKFDVVVIRQRAWDSLTEVQQDDLRAAAKEAGQRAESARFDEGQALDAWCETPQAASVVATLEQLRALREELAPVVTAALSDPAAQALADRITELGAGTVPPRGRTCGSTIPEDLAPYIVDRAGNQDVFDGVWRLDVDEQVLQDAGLSPNDVAANSGTWTINVTGHIADVEQPHGDNCSWDFYINGDEVTLDFSYDANDACYGLVRGTYERSGDQVTFTWSKQRYYDVDLDNALFHHGMHKVG